MLSALIRKLSGFNIKMLKFHLVQFFLLYEYVISGTEKVCFETVVYKAFYYRFKKVIQHPPGDKIAQLTVYIKSCECNQDI